MTPPPDFVPVVTRLPAAVEAEAAAIAEAEAEQLRLEREREAAETDAERLARESQ
jgi:hypothetical protein